MSHPDPNATLGIWVRDGLAYASGPAGLRIHDLRDPATPIVLAEDVAGTQGTRDVEVFEHPAGGLYAAMTIDADPSTILLVDVTDPRSPAFVSSVETVERAHTVSVVPGTAVVYVSRSTSTHAPAPGSTGQMHLIDWTDPANPSFVIHDFPAVAMTVGGVPRPVSGLTCHEVTQDALHQRAYCAAITDTIVFDTTEPLAPVIVQVIDNPLVDIHHSAYVAYNGTFLAIGTEFVGVLAPLPGCQDAANAPVSGFWFYDVSDLANPAPLGYYSAPFNAPAELGPAEYCGPHLGDIDEEHDLMAVSWYQAGHYLVDISDPANPRTLASHVEPGRNGWEARFMGPNVVTSDTQLGLGVLTLK